MTPRYLLPTLAAALLLSATTGCQDTSEADGFDLEEPADTGSPDAGLSDAANSGTPSVTLPDADGTPCWPAQYATPSNTRRSPCDGPTEPDDSQLLFSKTFDKSPEWISSRVGPADMLVVVYKRRERNPTVLVFDTSSDARTSWRLDNYDGLAVTSGGQVVTLDVSPRSSANHTAHVQSYTPSGSRLWSRRLPLPEGVDILHSTLQVFPETREHGIRALVTTDTSEKLIFHLTHDGTLRKTARHQHTMPYPPGFGPRHHALLIHEPLDSDDQKVRLKALLSGPDGPREIALSELGFDLQAQLGEPDTTYARPLFATFTSEALFLVTPHRDVDYNWVCRVPYPTPSEGTCTQIHGGENLRGFTHHTLLVDNWLVGLEGRPESTGPLDGGPDSPGLGAARLDRLATAADDYRPLVDDDYEAMNWVADARGVVYARIRPDQSDAHQELLAARPDGTRLWQRDVGLPDDYPDSLVVGDGHLYATYLHNRETPARLEVYQVGQ